MLRNMMVAYGSPNYAAPAYAQCKGPREVGYKLTFGEPLGGPEPLDFDTDQLHGAVRLAPRRERSQQLRCRSWSGPAPAARRWSCWIRA